MSRRFLAINFFILILVMFLFVAVGQWNHPNFELKAYEAAKGLVTSDLVEKGERPDRFIEPPEISFDVLHVGVINGEGDRFDYEVGIKNPMLIHMSALNLFVAPRLEILSVTPQP